MEKTFRRDHQEFMDGRYHLRTQLNAIETRLNQSAPALSKERQINGKLKTALSQRTQQVLELKNNTQQLQVETSKAIVHLTSERDREANETRQKISELQQRLQEVTSKAEAQNVFSQGNIS